jgi:hypothetical protein
MMVKKAPSAAPFRVVLALMIASLACSNPIQDYFSTQASHRDTATAAMFTLTATNTNTRRPTRTSTPSITPSQTRTKTRTLAPTDTPLPIDTPMEGSETPPAPGRRTPTKTGPTDLQPNRFTETAGLTKFSYVPPPGWKQVPASGSNLTSWEGPGPKGSMASMLLFYVEKTDKSSAEAGKELASSLATANGVKIISQGRFNNNAGLDAYKMVIVMSNQGENIQVVFYFFQKNGFLIEAGFMRLLEQNKDLDAIVDQCLETLQYE